MARGGRGRGRAKQQGPRGLGATPKQAAKRRRSSSEAPDLDLSDPKRRRSSSKAPDLDFSDPRLSPDEIARANKAHFNGDVDILKRPSAFDAGYIAPSTPPDESDEPPLPSGFISH